MSLMHLYDGRLKAIAFGQASPLTAVEQQVVKAYFWQDKPLSQIARETRVTRQSLESYLRRALKKLGRALSVKES